MRNKKHKSEVPVEYKRSTWKMEIKGNLNNPFVKNMIVWDFILGWLIRAILVVLAIIKVVSSVFLN